MDAKKATSIREKASLRHDGKAETKELCPQGKIRAMRTTEEDGAREVDRAVIIGDCEYLEISPRMYALGLAPGGQDAG